MDFVPIVIFMVCYVSDVFSTFGDHGILGRILSDKSPFPLVVTIE